MFVDERITRAAKLSDETFDYSIESRTFVEVVIEEVVGPVHAQRGPLPVEAERKRSLAGFHANLKRIGRRLMERDQRRLGDWVR